ncbi:hypothetical protein LVB87_04650 [Lysobacter sp. KIS68-7]|uniref:hypothetical protein n=1 Tax=Lysobacter sp. KIS68-7 TaxID=2904252 RepID=UPI001E5FDFDF|nr:hypothetical protein [Lysobacter sp. KIS68-7]UHQ20454.1 hypothetical protein LVB87_04650 [Lysobacter sp. KIS68-7]
MRNETTRLFKDLLFLNGHVADPRLGAELASEQPEATPERPSEGTMNLFKSLWLLGGLESISLRVGEDDELAFGPTYGNDVASQRVFGKRVEDEADDAVVYAPRVKAKPAHAARMAHC